MSDAKRPFDPEGIYVRSRDVMPGVWEDGNGHLHFSRDELLAHFGMERTPENLKLVDEFIAAVLADVSKQLGRPVNLIHRAKGYTIAKDGKSIRCEVCGRVSFNAGDVRNLYCGNCHRFHEA